MKKIVTWIVLADSARARVVSNEGPGRGVITAPDKVFQGANLSGREIQADRAGRTFDSAGQGRHAMEPRTDPRDVAKQDFIRQVAAFLDDENNRGAFDRLIVVAPPKALGLMRAALSEQVKSRITGELNKDLIDVPIRELADHLGDVLAV